jgi:hypothetical protein
MLGILRMRSRAAPSRKEWHGEGAIGASLAWPEDPIDLEEVGAKPRVLPYGTSGSVDFRRGGANAVCGEAS